MTEVGTAISCHQHWWQKVLKIVTYMNSTRNWYVVYTQPQFEKKVTRNLMAVGIESLCPLLKVRKQWVGRKKMISEPLFPSYVFVKVSPQEHSLLRLTTGVINLVYWLGKPAVIKEEETIVIQRFIKDHESISLQKLPVNIH